MRSKTVIVIEKTPEGIRVFCNDPAAEVKKVGCGGDSHQMGDECGICLQHHLPLFSGDCRDDQNRFTELAQIVLPR